MKHVLVDVIFLSNFSKWCACVCGAAYLGYLDLRLQASKWKSCQEKVGQRVVWDQSDLAFIGSASW